MSDRALELGRQLPEPVKDVLRPAARRLRARARTRATRAMSLDEIGLATGTDKSTRIHGYLPVYDQLFAHLRDEPFQLVEIGVHKGASTDMWQRYFARAQVVGVDIDPACRERAGGRVSVLIGSQGDPAFLAELAERLDPLIVLDDGSHRWEHQIATLRALLPIVRPGGFYVIEDIHTSFGKDYVRTYGTPGHPSAYDVVAGLLRGLVAGTRADPPADEFEQYFRSVVQSATVLTHSVVLRTRRDSPARLR